VFKPWKKNLRLLSLAAVLFISSAAVIHASHRHDTSLQTSLESSCTVCQASSSAKVGWVDHAVPTKTFLKETPGVLVGSTDFIAPLLVNPTPIRAPPVA
jgi:hypothetical protein